MGLYSNSIVQADLSQIINRNESELARLDGKCVLITGANGMLAYYFTCVLLHANIVRDLHISVIALVRDRSKANDRFSAFLNDPHFHLVVQDICNPLSLPCAPDCVFHAASSASPKWINADPVGIIRANTIGTMNVCEVAKDNSSCRVLFASTREVYGEVVGLELLSENDMGALDPLQPRSCYPESKRLAEQICASYKKQHGMDYVIARIAHVYGPGMDIDNDGRVMSDFVADALYGRDIVLNSKGDAIRAFCYIEDAISALLLLMVNGVSGEVYNVANETEQISVLELAQMLSEISPVDCGVVFADNCDRSGYTTFKRVALNCSKLNGLGWRPSVGLRDGLARTLESFCDDER